MTKVLAETVGAKERIVALDISPKMVNTARRRISTRQNVEVHLAEVEAYMLKRGASI